jgi:FlaA1/EpsC-like NDP-sugar epimerase
MKVTDIADTIAPNVKHKIIGILPGEKLHEQMISAEDSYSTYEYPNHYKILPQINEWGKDVKRIKDGIKVPEGFVYSSDTNLKWMTKEQLRIWLDTNKNILI